MLMTRLTPPVPPHPRPGSIRIAIKPAHVLTIEQAFESDYRWGGFGTAGTDCRDGRYRSGAGDTGRDQAAPGSNRRPFAARFRRSAVSLLTGCI